MMFEKRIEVEGGQKVTLLEMAANVALEGWGEPDVLVRLREGAEHDLTVEAGEGGPVLSARNNVEIFIPGDLQVQVRNVRGNLAGGKLSELDAEQVGGNCKVESVGRLAVTEVYGNLKAESIESVRVPGTVYGSARFGSVAQVDVQNVRGDLVVKSGGRVRATRVGGSLVAKQIGEGLDVDEVGGNATLKDIAARASIDRVAGNLIAKNMMGGARVSRIGGNIALSGPLAAGQSYHFQADGNAAIRVPEGTGADVTLQARGRVIAAGEVKEDAETRGRWTGKLGDGGAELFVDARGNVILGGDSGRGWTISDEMSDEVTRQMEEVARQVEEAMRGVDFEAIGRQVSSEVDEAMSRLRVKLESVDWERIGHRTQEAIERAMGRMQQDVDRVAERAARHQERSARQQEAAAARQAAAAERRARAEARAEKRAARADRPEAWACEMDAEAGQPDVAPEDAYMATGDRPSPWAEEGFDAGPGPDLDEERLSILRMVEQGQISPEEAEMLLDALE
jgi:hypothetical protein